MGVCADNTVLIDEPSEGIKIETVKKVTLVTKGFMNKKEECVRCKLNPHKQKE